MKHEVQSTMLLDGGKVVAINWAKKTDDGRLVDEVTSFLPREVAEQAFTQLFGVEVYVSGRIERWYTVRDGDTLSEIALRFGVEVEHLVRLNDLRDPNFIRIGQRLQLPDLVLRAKS